MVAETIGADHQSPAIDGPLGDQSHVLVNPPYEQSRVHVGGKITRAQTHDYRLRREIGKGKVHRAAGRNAAEELVLSDPAHAAGPVSLPAPSTSLSDADGSQVRLLRLGRLGQPEHSPSVLRVPA